MNAPSSTPSPPKLPSETVRGLVSLLIFVHLLALIVAMGSYTSASVFQRQLVTALRPYIRTLNFDLAHVFPTVARLHLTHAGPSDVDFQIAGEAKLPSGEFSKWQLPREGLFPPIRGTRDQTLANVVGGLLEADQEEREALLPRALAAAELRKADAKSGTITVIAHYLLEIEDLKSPDTKLRNPFDANYFRPVFAASVIATPFGGVDLLKSVGKGEVAPVTGASGNTSKSTPAKGKE